MQRYIIRRVFYGFISLWLLTIIIFLLIQFTPGPALMYAERGASETRLQSIRIARGLDKPLLVQYKC